MTEQTITTGAISGNSKTAKRGRPAGSRSRSKSPAKTLVMGAAAGVPETGTANRPAEAAAASVPASGTTAAPARPRRIRNRSKQSSGIKNRPAAQPAAASSAPATVLAGGMPCSFTGESWNGSEPWSTFERRQITAFTGSLTGYRNYLQQSHRPLLAR